MKVPYVDLVAHNAPFRAEMLAAVERVLEHGQFILGPEVAEFEREIEGFTGAKHVVSCSSGTSALTLALRALGIEEGDEVITCSHSFVATATSIRLVGAQPRFVDIDLDNGLIDPSALEGALSSRTKAVLVVHLGGIPCPMDAIASFCDTHNLQLVEDCAQAIGARFDGRHVGTFGVGCFSLHPLKTLSACGDAGFLTTADMGLAKKLRELRNVGLATRDDLSVVGENARLDTLHAAMLLPKVKALPRFIERRNESAAAYRRELKAPIEHFSIPSKGLPAYSCYAVRVKNRDQVLKSLRSNGVDAKVHYPVPIHKQSPFASQTGPSLPNTEQLAAEIISLPVAPELTNAQRTYVIETVTAATRSGS